MFKKNILNTLVTIEYRTIRYPRNLNIAAHDYIQCKQPENKEENRKKNNT
jgi:hypothetical protein